MPIKSYVPKVSLDPKVHYTTQASSYDRLLDNGPLTNRKIAAYQRAGRYGEDQKKLAVAKQKRAKRAGGTSELARKLELYE